MQVPPPGTFHGRHAVVIGASISGLLAARVLAAHFDRVTLFDRDALPREVENRRGVPQGPHGHGLLASGLRGLKRLFPTLERDLLEQGAVPGDVIGDVRWFQHGHYKAQFASGLDGLLLSRALLETTIRRHVSRLPNVGIEPGVHVQELMSGPDRIAGVRVQHRSERSEEVPADFVVDASGRASRSPQWLNALGYGQPRVEEVGVDLGYTTRIFKRKPGDLSGNFGAIVAPKPPLERRAGFILAMEGGRWVATLAGWLGEHAPTEMDGYLEFARSLARPDIYDVVSTAEPLGDAVKYVFPSNLRRRYELMARFPAGYLVIGDAVCSFNPLYGQGMSVATLEALGLADCLASLTSIDRLWRPYAKAMALALDSPWTIAAGGDLAFEGVTGRRARGSGAVNWYLDHVHRAASTDRAVCRTFFDVANLLKPASALFAPPVVARVARASIFGGYPTALNFASGAGVNRRTLRTIRSSRS
jgi:2-polyprenyl-6-methoxyphenol hydroxylase-like FAD-dependent oxidoreductase